MFELLFHHQTLDTVAVAEGTNLYWTTARGQSMFDTRLGTKDTADLTEGSNLYHTTERVQDIAASMFSSGTQSGISVTYDDTNGTLSLNVGDPTLTISGDGTATSTMTDLGNTTLSLTLSDTAVSAGSYGSASLVPIITVDSKGRVTAASTTSVAGVTDFDYNTSTGVLDIDTADGNNFDTTVTLGPFTTSTLTEGSNLYFTDARVITSLASVSGHIIPDTDVTYDLGSSTYKFRDLYLSGSSIKLGSATITASGTTVVLPVGSKISGGGVLLDLTTHDTDDLSEGSTNLYYLDSRARGSVSVTDSGGDGSLAYNSSTGVITYTGPSASEVRAHLSAGTGVGVSSGVISIGQAVGTTDDVTFDDVVISGNLTVSGTTTTIDTNTLNIGDNIITLNSDEAGTPSQNAGIEVERGTSTNKTFIWDEANDRWTVGSETMVASTFIGDVTGTTSDISNHSTSDLSEGTNLYYLDSRARAAISVTDSGGDGSLAYNSTTGVITYVGPSSSEVRAHLSSPDTAGHGAFSYNSSTGVFSHTRVTSAEVRGDISVATSGDGSLAYASGTGSSCPRI